MYFLEKGVLKLRLFWCGGGGWSWVDFKANKYVKYSFRMGSCTFQMKRSRDIAVNWKSVPPAQQVLTALCTLLTSTAFLVVDGERKTQVRRPSSPASSLVLLTRAWFKRETNMYSGNEIASLFMKHIQARSCKQAPSKSKHSTQRGKKVVSKFVSKFTLYSWAVATSGYLAN